LASKMTRREFYRRARRQAYLDATLRAARQRRVHGAMSHEQVLVYMLEALGNTRPLS
jgi:hypothetical protein